MSDKKRQRIWTGAAVGEIASQLNAMPRDTQPMIFKTEKIPGKAAGKEVPEFITDYVWDQEAGDCIPVTVRNPEYAPGDTAMPAQYVVHTINRFTGTKRDGVFTGNAKEVIQFLQGVEFGIESFNAAVTAFRSAEA